METFLATCVLEELLEGLDGTAKGFPHNLRISSCRLPFSTTTVDQEVGFSRFVRNEVDWFWKKPWIRNEGQPLMRGFVYACPDIWGARKSPPIARRNVVTRREEQIHLVVVVVQAAGEPKAASKHTFVSWLHSGFKGLGFVA